MKRRDPRERVRAGLGEALDRDDRERSRREGRGPEPWPGDLFVLAETAGFPVEWLLVERGRQSRCQVVAADANPILGCADVALPPEAAAGPLSVRCAVGLAIEVESLRRGQRTGTLTAEDLDRIRGKRDELATEGVADSRLGAGGEPDSDYEDWLDEVLLPARAALSPAVEEEPVRGRRWGRNGIAAAAALSLLLTLLGFSALAWRSHQAERQAWQEVHRLTVERQRLLAAHRGELAVRQAAEAQRLAELRVHTVPPPVIRRPPLRVLANLAYASFYPGETRGTVRELALPAGATYLFALFYVGQQAPYPEYRLEVTGRAGAPAWSVPGLRPLPSQEVSVALPRAQLPEGSYLFDLYGLRDKERTSVGEYEVRIRSLPGSASSSP